MYLMLAILNNFKPLFGTAPCGHYHFFFLPPWWEYLNQTTDQLGQCSPIFHFPGDIFPVALAILDMLLRLAGFVAVVSIIIAGSQYIVSMGNAEKVTSARKRIINSLIGLAIAFTATLAVAFIGSKFGG